jgi:hypothetical protein
MGFAQNASILYHYWPYTKCFIQLVLNYVCIQYKCGKHADVMQLYRPSAPGCMCETPPFQSAVSFLPRIRTEIKHILEPY